MSIFDAMKKAKGLGSAHNGTHHFIHQRITAVILIPLVLYFMYSVAHLAGLSSYPDVIMWFSNPFNSGVAITLVLIAFYHAALGVQVVLEDYVHHEHLKWVSLIIVRGICVLGAATAVVSILHLAI